MKYINLGGMEITTLNLIVLDQSIFSVSETHRTCIKSFEHILHWAYFLIRWIHLVSSHYQEMRVLLCVSGFSLAKLEYAGFSCQGNCFEMVCFSLLTRSEGMSLSWSYKTHQNFLLFTGIHILLLLLTSWSHLFYSQA